jgi:hypothetical protein
MKRYREPGFQERITAAARARNEALTQLRTRPPVDETLAAARLAKGLAQETARLEKRRVARMAADEAKAAKRDKALEAAAARAVPEKPALSEDERKAARDARYLARKSRTAS